MINKDEYGSFDGHVDALVALLEKRRLQAKVKELTRENAEYEEGNDADAEVIQLLQAKVEELTKAITDFREGNYAHPRTYHPNDCPHGAHYWQDCANCDEGYWQSVLQEGE